VAQLDGPNELKAGTVLQSSTHSPGGMSIHDGEHKFEAEKHALFKEIVGDVLKLRIPKEYELKVAAHIVRNVSRERAPIYR